MNAEQFCTFLEKILQEQKSEESERLRDILKTKSHEEVTERNQGFLPFPFCIVFVYNSLLY